MFANFTFKRFLKYFFLSVAKMPMFAHQRGFFLKRAGIKICGRCYVYKNVSFDTVHPEFISIGNNVRITEGTKVLTHFIDPSQEGIEFKYGHVVIEDNVFIGVNSVIFNAVTIGESAVVGAGSIVTKDIPAYQVWAGCPARFIKERAH